VAEASPSPPPSPDRRKLLVALGYTAANAAALVRFGRGGRTAGRRGGTGESDGPEVPARVEGATSVPDDLQVYDTVIAGGRVIDPESGYDRVADVGIVGESVAAISAGRLQGRATIDATNKVVAPGFIDLLSYEPEDHGARYKIGDGVTTNLGMHGINANAADFFARFTGNCFVNFGGAFDNPWVRSTQFGLDPGDEASPQQVAEMSLMCAQQLSEGWIGVDFEPEYTPGISVAEMTALAGVAKAHDVPCFFHGRYSAVGTNAQTLDEIIGVAKATGAAVHIEHIISTGGTFDMAGSLARVESARRAGYDVTACMYPYNYWATYLGSTRFNPGWQERFRISYGDLQVAGTSERLTEDTFRQYQQENKLAAAYAIPEEDVRTALRSDMVMIGSDAILTTGNNHPRATGCFARTLGRYVREEKTISLTDALAKMTIIPARRLERRAAALRKKGRLQLGADADITVFDPNTVIDRSTVENPAQFSAGIEHVLMLGQVVKTPEGVDETKRLGRPVTGVRA